MKKRVFFGLLILILVVTTLLSACSSTQSTLTSSTKTSTSSITATKPAATSTATATLTNWWDKYGTPQYGGKITYACGGLRAVNFDTYSLVGEENDIWFEALFEPDWTLNPDTEWFMFGNFAPDQYYGGNLAESWTQTDATTITIKVRQGIKWQDKAPVNGREFTANDIAAHYNRVLGWDGKTEASPMYMGMTTNWASVTATDKYTVVFKFKAASTQNFQSMADRVSLNQIEAPEFAAMSAPDNSSKDPKQDPANAVGTGPWMLKEFIDGSAFSYVKNPTYWGTDPRFPKNQTPYADELSMLVIGDASTRLAALRTGKLDTVGGGGNTFVDWKSAKILADSNPDLQFAKITGGNVSICGRLDKAPFTDIRVRKAICMAIDRTAIANSIYGGTGSDQPVGVIDPIMKGYCYPYEEWPQSLKDEYTYNPTKAKELLAEAGFPNGFKTNVVTGGTNTEVMEAFKAMFMDIGVDMEIRTMDSVTLEAFMRAGKHDQMIGGAGASSFPPSRTIDLAYSKGGTDAISLGLAAPGGDPIYDAYRDKFWAAATQTEAMNIMKEMDKYVIGQHWGYGTGLIYNYVYWQPWLKGYNGESTQWSQGVLWSRLWVDPSLKK